MEQYSSKEFEEFNRIEYKSGELEGFYIDLQYQETGYQNDPPEHIERLKISILKFMLESPGEYITCPKLNLIEEYNSVDLSKSVSSLKSSFVKALSYSHTVEEAKLLASSVIMKRKLNGHMGYTLSLEGAELTGTPGKPQQTDDLPNNIDNSFAPAAALGDRDRSGKGSRFKEYLKSNWFYLMLLLYMLIIGTLWMSETKTNISNILDSFIKLPGYVIFTGLTALSILPIITGLVIDRSIAIKSFVKKHPERSAASLSKEELHRIVMYDEGRFDMSRTHIVFFSMCNLTGGLALICLNAYAATLEDIGSFLDIGSCEIPLALITASGFFAALYMNYKLQTVPVPSRNPVNYRLSRIHAFINVLYLFITLPLSGGLSFIIFAYCLYRPQQTGIDITFCLVLLSAYSYIWFSACSPMADELDSVSRQNYVTGIPILSGFVLAYTLLRFDGSLTAYISLGIIILCTSAWLLFILSKGNRRAAKLTDSFFGYVALTVITLLIIGHIGHR